MADSHIWCRKKSEVRNLKGFLEWVDHSFELIDWWEEDDKYCFETRRSPKEKGRGRGGEG
jgi:P2-related tail formation protein